LLPKREEAGQSGKQLTQQTAEERKTEQATNFNQYYKKCGMNRLKNTSLISKGKIIIFGNL